MIKASDSQTHTTSLVESATSIGRNYPITEHDNPFTNLKPREMAFVEHYLSNGRNGAEAAESAGYPKRSARSRAYELLREPLVQIAIKVLEETNWKASYIGKDVLVREAWEIHNNAKGAGDFHASIKALVLIAKVNNLEAPTQINLNLNDKLAKQSNFLSNLSDEELEREVNEREEFLKNA